MRRREPMFCLAQFLDPLRTAFLSDGDEQASKGHGDHGFEALKFLEEELERNKFFGEEKIGLTAAHWLAHFEESAGWAKPIVSQVS
ncbi:hypothetical protein ACLOJK_025433 [Asimina triloba]